MSYPSDASLLEELAPDVQLHSRFSSYLSSVAYLAEVDPAQAADSWETIDARLDEVLFPALASPEDTVCDTCSPYTDVTYVDSPIPWASPRDKNVGQYFPELPAIPQEPYWYAHILHTTSSEATDPFATYALPTFDARYAWDGVQEHTGLAVGPMAMAVDAFADASAIAPIAPLVPIPDAPTVPKQKGRKRKFAETFPSDAENVETKVKKYVCVEDNCEFGESNHLLVAVGSRLDASCARAASDRRYNLKQHINGVHKNIRPHPCTRCNQSFQRKCDMERHFQSAHTNDGSPQNPQSKGKLKAAKAAKSS